MFYEEDIYARYAAGELTEEEITKLKESGELEELDKILKSADELSLPDYDLDGAYAKLKERNSQIRDAKQPTIIRRLAWPLSIAASLFLIAGAFLFFRNDTTTILADHTASKMHTFKDGSTVNINKGTKIEFDEKNWEEARTVNLEGEAFFEVEKGIPFTVETVYGTVEVLGTSFNIRTHDELLDLNCFTGKVKVTNKSGKEVVLTASESVQLTNQKFSPVKKLEDAKPSWQQGVSRFEDVAATLVFEELERQFGLPIFGEIPKTPFTGSFGHNNLNEALTQICEPLGLDFTLNKDEVYIKAK